MSESDQDALLDQIESRRRWRAIKSRAIIAIGCLIAVAIGVALAFAP